MNRRSLSPFYLFAALLAAHCGKDNSSAEGGPAAQDSGAGGTVTTASDDVQTAQSASESADTAGSSGSAAPASTQATGTRSLITNLPRPRLPKGAPIDPKACATDANRLLGPGGAFTIKGDMTAHVLGCASQRLWSVDAQGSDTVFTGDVTLDPNNCHGGRALSGTCKLTSIVNSSGSGNEFDVDESIAGTLADGDKLSINSNDMSAPTYMIQTTGSPASGTVTLTTTVNEHRTRTGKVTYDHTIYTDADAPLTIVNTYDQQTQKAVKRTITGTLEVHHNIAKFLAKHTFDGLTRDLTGTCACPTGGSITQVVTKDDGTEVSTRAYTFTGCGTATVTTTGGSKKDSVNGSATVKFDSCQ